MESSLMQVVAHDDAVSIVEYFGDLEDPRSTINRQHLLGDLIVISVCGVLAGADGPKAIGVWARAHAEWLRQYLELPHGIPSHDTIGRLLAALRPAAFRSCFEQWIKSLRQGLDGVIADEVIAIDGKALRRSHHRSKSLGPLFLVSAWSVQQGISLGQLATDEKSNEITAIPELLDHLDIHNATVTIDAAGCQKNIAAKIIDQGGDYLLALKGNQVNLHQAVIEQMDNHFSTTTVDRYVETMQGHGREDTVEYFHLPVPKKLPGASLWKELKTIGVAVRTSLQNGKETTDIRFFISSLSLGVRRFATACRGHWGIENSLHWCLDVTFREDESRVRDRFAADNLAWLKRFAISLLKQQTDKESIAMRRRMAGWNVDDLMQVLAITPS
jgi:predicted transposase YbfD/YdcC